MCLNMYSLHSMSSKQLAYNTIYAIKYECRQKIATSRLVDTSELIGKYLGDPGYGILHYSYDELLVVNFPRFTWMDSYEKEFLKSRNFRTTFDLITLINNVLNSEAIVHFLNYSKEFARVAYAFMYSLMFQWLANEATAPRSYIIAIDYYLDFFIKKMMS